MFVRSRSLNSVDTVLCRISQSNERTTNFDSLLAHTEAKMLALLSWTRLLSHIGPIVQYLRFNFDGQQ